MPLTNPAVQAALVTMLLVAIGLVTAVLIRLTAAVSDSKLTLSQAVQQVRTSLPASGGAGKRNVTLPAYDQLHDPLPDGSLPPLRANECGEECVAEIVYWVHGVEVAADAIRVQARGLAGGALTTAADLVSMLAASNVAARAGIQDVGSIQKFLLDVVAGKRLVIVLGNWVSAGVPHWVIVYNASSNGVTISDPWGGRRYNIAWPTFTKLYLASTVEIISTPDASLTS
jgi:hypothetical protein